jgi:hypothetical protein
MVPIWCIVGLIVAALSVSTLGAAFSVIGLSALFSGAALAVCAMATSLEFAKFVLSAYLHQRWSVLNIIFKSYLTLAIVVLSLITSMGIFGFLSNAYQSSTAVLDSENIKLETLKNQKSRNATEIARITKGIEEIPATRITRRLKARTEAEPAINALTKQTDELEDKISESNLRILEVKQKVGPLIYIAKMFQVDIDSVVKYLIFVFVFVFDPLAICLVIATSEALNSRRTQNQSQNQSVVQNSDTPIKLPENPQIDEVIQMRFADEKDQSTG